MTADAMVLIEGEYGVSPDFEWRPGKPPFIVRCTPYPGFNM